MSTAVVEKEKGRPDTNRYRLVTNNIKKTKTERVTTIHKDNQVEKNKRETAPCNNETKIGARGKNNVQNLGFLLERHLLLDLGNGEAGVQALGARPRAVEDRVAAVEAHGVLKGLHALGLFLVARVGQPAVRLQQDRRAQVLLRVPPVGRARCRAAEAQDALVQAVELLAVLLALTVFAALWYF